MEYMDLKNVLFIGKLKSFGIVFFFNLNFKLKEQMKYFKILILILILVTISNFVFAQEKEIPYFDNPIFVEYFKKNLRKSQPRLVLNSQIEKELKTDPVTQNRYQTI